MQFGEERNYMTSNPDLMHEVIGGEGQQLSKRPRHEK